MDQVVAIAKAEASKTDSSAASDAPYGSESDGAGVWDEDIVGQPVPAGIFAGFSPERVKAEFVRLHSSIVSIGLKEEQDDIPETNPWWEPEPDGMRAKMRRKVAEAQAALFEEALEDYHAEVAVAREKAAAEGFEITEHMEIMAAVNGVDQWWDEQTAIAEGKGPLSLTGATVIGNSNADRVELRAKRARDRADRIAMRLLVSRAQKAEQDKGSSNDVGDTKPVSKWDKAKIATKRKVAASKDHAKVVAKAWRRNAKPKPNEAYLTDPCNLSFLREKSLPPLSDPSGHPLNDEHPAIGLLPEHVIKHVTTRAAYGEAGDLSDPAKLTVEVEAVSSFRNRGKQRAAAVADTAAGKRRAGAEKEVGAVQQGRMVRKRHNREALAAMSKGNWEERIAYLQYELKRPPSADAGTNSTAVGKTSRYRRWGRLGATSHLNALGDLDAEEADGSNKQARARKKRESRKPALPDVPVRRAPRVGGARAGRRRRGYLENWRDVNAPGFGPDDQRVLTQVYLGAVEAPASPTAATQIDGDGDGGGTADGKSSVWFKDRVATPNGHEYLAV